MTLKTSMVLTIFGLTCISELATAQGNLVFNGSFNTDASGWTLANLAYFDNKAGNPLPCVDLLGLTAAATQTINNLSSGTTYVISGDYRIYGSSTNPCFGVSMDGVILFQDATQQPDIWQSFSIAYTAASSSATLSLARINAAGIDCDIDNIAIYAIPEPGSLCLLGVGGMISAIFFRNRRKD